MMLKRRRSKAPEGRHEIIARRRQEMSAAQPSTSTYRRSRTLLRGTSSDPVQKSERQAGHDLRRQRRRLTLWLALSTLSIIGVVFILDQLVVSVRVVTPGSQMIGASGKEEERLVNTLNEYLSTRPVERLRFAVNKSDIHAYFSDKAPEVQSLQLLPGKELAESTLKLSFRQPVIKWVSGGRDYYVDGQGVVFRINFFNEPRVQVEDTSGVAPELGHESVNRQFLSFLGQAVAKYDEVGYQVTRAVLPEGTIRQVDFGFADKAYTVRMTVDRGVGPQVERSVKAIGFFEHEGVPASYIDARVDQRVYYR